MPEQDVGLGRPPDDRWKYGYELVATYRCDTTYPPDYRNLDGAIDFHMHVGFSRIDPVAQLKLASRAGMRGIVFKISQLPTVELARITTQEVHQWAEREGLRPAEAFGGVVLGPMVGGINLLLVRRIIKIGGRIVWLPVLESARHLEHARGLTREEAQRQGTSILDGGRLLPEVVELVKIVADADIALSLGHQGPEEMMAVAEVIDKVGYKKAYIDHPFNPPMGLSAQNLYDLAKLGLYLNWTYWELSHWVGIDPRAMDHVTRKVGVDQVILSTDSCFAPGTDSVEGMRLMVEIFRAFGFGDEDMRKLKSLNACRLLGVEPYPPAAGKDGEQ